MQSYEGQELDMVSVENASLADAIRQRDARIAELERLIESIRDARDHALGRIAEMESAITKFEFQLKHLSSTDTEEHAAALTLAARWRKVAEELAACAEHIGWMSVGQPKVIADAERAIESYTQLLKEHGD